MSRKNLFENEIYLSPTDGYPERPVSWFKKEILPDALGHFEGRETLLDVGSAHGYFTVLFADNFSKVVGIDFSANRINFAKRHWNKLNVSFIQTPIEEFSSDIHFDAMFTSMVIQHIPKQDKIEAFKKLSMVAAEDCKFLLYDFNSNYEEVTDDWVAPISPLWIAKYLKGIWRCESCERFTKEGPSSDNYIYRYILRKDV
jgi:ubiquinone/menaquinone biosynthesis C-methylase UbiE